MELRHCPAAVAVETTAPSGRDAFGRLFRYIDGTNREREALPMTAPVETVRRGREIPMTAPVSTTEGDADTWTAFCLPAEYDYRRAPEPTEAGVHLVAVPERTVAVRRFSWWATPGRVRAQTRRLDRTLEETGYTPTDEPSPLQYDAPWSVPFLRRNEVAVPVRP